MTPLPGDGVLGRGDVPSAVVAALDRLGRARRLHRQDVASAHGLTVLQLDLLLTLAGGVPTDPSVGALAREVGVSQPTVTDSLRSLERKGLVARTRPGADRRRRLLTLTPSGRELVAEADRGEDAARDAVARLATERQEEVLGALLEVIASFVRAGVIDVARTCLTCRFHRTTHAGGDHCTLLGTDLAPGELRVNCPEHVPVGT